MKEHAQTVGDLVARLRQADQSEFNTLEKALSADTRVTVQRALESARKRLAAIEAERVRLEGMYAFQDDIAHGRAVMGLDEVGRGPLAGPLTVAAVVLPATPHIPGLNDSKQVAKDKRALIAQRIKECALAWSIKHVEPAEIDDAGMSLSLRKAFSAARDDIDSQIDSIECVLIDGNPLHFDKRETNIIKGDGKCASIAAASIIAKVARDDLMVGYAHHYPAYGFDSNKGYGSADHIAAIKEHGLSPIHRISFCQSFTQETLF